MSHQFSSIRHSSSISWRNLLRLFSWRTYCFHFDFSAVASHNDWGPLDIVILWALT